MRLLLACAVALLFSSGSVRARPQAPFLDLPGTVDHVVTMAVLRGWTGQGPDRSFKIMRRGGWTAIAYEDGSGRPDTFMGRGGETSVSIIRRSSGEVGSVQVRRGPPEDCGYGFKTRETHVVLGEVCEVWNVARIRRKYWPPRSDADYACVAGDGVVLSFRRLNSDGSDDFRAEATRVERRPVHPFEAHPPAALLSLESWIERANLSEPANLLEAEVQDDYEIVLKDPGEPGRSIGAVLTRRRHRSWLFEDKRYGDGGRRISIHDARTSFRAFFSYFPRDGRKTLYIDVGSSHARSAPWLSPIASPTDRKDMALGETCMWYGEPPHPHGSRSVSFALDGIALKEHGGGGSYYGPLAFDAVRVRRGRVSLAGVLPSAALLEPGWWGFPPTPAD